MSEAPAFAGELFGAQAERSAWFADAVSRRIDANRALRVLDIGCGTGAHLFALADRLPAATFLGVDISAPNIEHAERAKAGHAAAARISFFHADYLKHQGGVFDLIVSDSSLHLISGTTENLFSKLATDLAPGGLLLASIPDCSLYNYVLWGVRRLFAALRSRWLDELAVAISVRWYRNKYDEAFLRQRIPYLYLLPLRCEGKELRATARECGLASLGVELAPHDSAMQPVHVLAAYRRIGES